MTAALSVSMFQGFNLDAYSFSDRLLPALCIAGLLQAVFLICSYSKKTIALGTAGMTAALTAAVLWMRSLELSIVDEIGSDTVIYIYPIVLFLSSVYVWLLSSARWGIAVLFPTGVVIMTALKYLEFDGIPVCFVLFQLACAAQLILLNYQKSAVTSDIVTPAFFRCGLTAVCSAALALAVSAGIYGAVIHPLGPPVRELHLLTKHIAVQSLDFIGIADDYPVTDLQERSNQTKEDSSVTSAPEEEAENTPENPDGNDDQKSQENALDGHGSGEEKEATAIRYHKNKYTVLWYILSVIFLLCLLFGGKLLQRRLWFKKAAGQSAGIQVEMFYLYFIDKLKIMGMERMPDDSPYIYAEKNAEKLKRFAADHTSFEELTDIFVRVRYGRYEARPEDCRRFQEFYREFHKNCRIAAGRAGYVRKFFFL